MATLPVALFSNGIKKADTTTVTSRRLTFEPGAPVRVSLSGAEGRARAVGSGGAALTRPVMKGSIWSERAMTTATTGPEKIHGLVVMVLPCRNL